MVTAPAVMPRLDPDVVKMVLPVGLPLVFWTVKSPESISGFVAIVYVRPAASVASNVTSWNSLAGRFVPAKVIVVFAEARKTIVPDPAAHDALVGTFVHEPPRVQVPLPNRPKGVADDTLPFPETDPCGAPLS